MLPYDQGQYPPYQGTAAAAAVAVRRHYSRREPPQGQLAPVHTAAGSRGTRNDARALQQVQLQVRHPPWQLDHAQEQEREGEGSTSGLQTVGKGRSR